MNGYRFHSLSYGSSKKTMNSGVCVKGSCYNEAEKDYYGLLEEIIELDYPGARNNVFLFKCHWYSDDGVRMHPRHDLVEINHKSRCRGDDIFILAEQVIQVYYMHYLSKKKTLRDWWVACKVKQSGAPEIPIIEPNDSAFQEDVISGLANNNFTNGDDEPIILVEPNIFEEVSVDEIALEVPRTNIVEDEEAEDEEEIFSDHMDLDVSNSENEVSSENDFMSEDEFSSGDDFSSEDRWTLLKKLVLKLKFVYQNVVLEEIECGSNSSLVSCFV